MVNERNCDIRNSLGGGFLVTHSFRKSIKLIMDVKLGPTKDEIVQGLINMSSYIKTITGIANNAAWAITLDCHDQVKKHPKYRHAVKKAFKDMLKVHKDYELGIKYNKHNLFCVKDMDESVRVKYKEDLTDADYLELWEGLGGAAYMESKPLITALHHKFKKSYENHGAKYPDILAHAMVGYTVLFLASSIYDQFLEICQEECNVPIKVANVVYNCLSMKNVSDAWTKAMRLLDNTEYHLDEGETRNVELGVQQLQKLWCDHRLLARSLRKAADDFDDVFRNKKMLRKVHAEINEIDKI